MSPGSRRESGLGGKEQRGLEAAGNKETIDNKRDREAFSQP